jgi:AraC-like DNA-binding protein
MLQTVMAQEGSHPFLATVGERRHPPSRLSALLSVVREWGMPLDAVLEGTGLHLEVVDNPSSLTSCAQFMRASRNAVRLCLRWDLGLHVGVRLRATSYGMYGYALLCSESLAHMWQRAIEYHPLSGGMLPLSWGVEGGHAVWHLPTRASFPWPEVDDRLYHFMTDLQMAAHLTIGKDVMGDWFLPECVQHAGPKPPHAQAIADALGCAIRFEQDRNALHFPASWLSRAPQMANPITAANVSQQCQRMLDGLRLQAGLTHSVYRCLTQTPGRFPDIEAVARQLCMSSRTLRRKLELEGVTFSELHTGVRKSLAMDYLGSTRMSTEDIADALGFCDPMSFAHAFKRWTGLTPRAYRQQGGVPAKAA